MLRTLVWSAVASSRHTALDRLEFRLQAAHKNNPPEGGTPNTSIVALFPSLRRCFISETDSDKLQKKWIA
ncbi:MAG: hypothetical protein QOH41_4220 [Blastocatellia bacterium]|jgi:hypothetical protein|nr:hypothetical protein [Blastocatellia bacterium]